jgi:hypothetical protein
MSVQPATQNAPQLADQVINTFRAQVRGDLILPADPRTVIKPYLNRTGLICKRLDLYGVD